ncbi:hypothetical protein A5791_07150 [Mycobacterium sp. 852002-51163_SCH5372311]|nr:hypothetical protein A5791_07150 [Mycobacterium sp. 852002-51163_SCH5372311]
MAAFGLRGWGGGSGCRLGGRLLGDAGLLGTGLVGGHATPHVVGLSAIATVGAVVEAKLKIQGCCPGGGKAGGGSTLGPDDGMVTAGGEDGM